MTAPTKRSRPTKGGAATIPDPKQTWKGSAAQLTKKYRRQDGYTAPDAEDREVADAIAVLHGYGYGIALRCLDCRRPITSAASLARMRGPRCAERAGVVL